MTLRSFPSFGIPSHPTFFEAFVDIVTLPSRHAERVRVSENIKPGSSSWFELRKLILRELFSRQIWSSLNPWKV